MKIRSFIPTLVRLAALIILLTVAAGCSSGEIQHPKIAMLVDESVYTEESIPAIQAIANLALERRIKNDSLQVEIVYIVIEMNETAGKHIPESVDKAAQQIADDPSIIAIVDYTLKGSITLSAKHLGGAVEIAVIDTGSGIPEKSTL